MAVSLDHDRLSSIKRELADRRFRLSFADQALEAEYQRQRWSLGCRHTKLAMLVTIVLFDLFILGEIRPCPEVLGLSALFRFGFVTPACLLFLLLDGRKWLGCWSETLLAVMLYLPTLFGCAETYAIHHIEALPNFQAVPLIQLALLPCRLTVRRSIWSVAAACVTYAVVACSKDYVPAVAVPSLVLTDICIGVTVLVFSSRLDYRERQVFLFELQSEIGRSMLAAQNMILSRLTKIDALTGLGNRRCFDEVIEGLWSDPRTRNNPVTLILFDIDHFKQYNDALGHLAGDDCLTTLARVVAQSLRDDSDKLARYGGEEFAVVLPGTHLEEGRAIADRIRMAVWERAIPHPESAEAGIVTVSLGVATVVPAEQNAAMMIEMADRCLYGAKRAGRNIAVSQSPAEAECQPAAVEAWIGASTKLPQAALQEI